MDLEKANEEITRLKVKNSDLCCSLQKLELSKAEMSEQVLEITKSKSLYLTKHIRNTIN